MQCLLIWYARQLSTSNFSQKFHLILRMMPEADTLATPSNLMVFIYLMRNAIPLSSSRMRYNVECRVI